MQRELIQKYLSLGEGMFGANSSLIEANERWHGGVRGLILISINM
jgi:hypothetical protein